MNPKNMSYLKFLKKVNSARIVLRLKLTSFKTYFWSKFNSNIKIGLKCEFHTNVFISQIGSGYIEIGNNCSFGDNVKIICENGNLEIGDNVYIGPHSIIVCINNILINECTQIAEHVTIRDQDHIISSESIINSGFKSSPILIGDNVWIGCKSSILRGSQIGNKCVIGAHSLVKSKIPDYYLALGVPAKPIKNLKKQ